MRLSLGSEVETRRPRVKVVSGRILAKRLRKGTMDPVHRAQLALQLQRGEVVIGNLTARQARHLVGYPVRRHPHEHTHNSTQENAVLDS